MESKSEKNIESLDSIIKVSLEEHKKWLSQAKQLARLRDTGWLKLFQSVDGAKATSYEQAIYRRLGIDFEILDAHQIQQLEPALKPIYGSALFIKDASSVDHPGEVTQSYIDLFVSKGGELIRDDIKQLRMQGKQVCLQGRTDYIADQLVLAAGPWSNDLLQTVSKPIPMCFERGYHQHYHFPAGPKLTRPVYDVDGAFVLTPTTQGYRLTSGSELKDKDAAASPVQLEEVALSAQHATELGPLVEESVWQGNRPTLPDSLPVIGRSAPSSVIWLAFGHQHVGFSTGPATGRLIAEMMAGESTFISALPFSPTRFH